MAKRKTQTKPAMNLIQLMEAYDTDGECRAVLEQLRWPDGVCCPRCEGEKVYRTPKQKARQEFDCASCGYQFSVTVGTIFQDSKLGLPKWFVATYLMCESKKGVSANQVKRMLGVSYKTAWYLCHRIRAAMKEADPEPLRGVVQFDETWIGGKRPGIGQCRKDHRTMVLGAVEQGGRVRFKVEKRRDQKTLRAFVRSSIADDADAIHTDSHPGYLGVGDADTPHHAVNHEVEWVRADGVHTNAAESVWSLLKRSIVGSYHQLSAKHLPAYLDEVAFKYNNRENAYLFRDTLMALVGADNLPYRKLVRN